MSETSPPHPAELALQALTTAAWVAVPDYVARPWQRRAVRAAIVATTTGGYVLLQRLDLTSEPEPGSDPEQEPDGPTTVKAFALVGGGVLASLVSGRASRRLSGTLVHRLEDRGVRRPWTVVGVGLAAVTTGMRVAERSPGRR